MELPPALVNEIKAGRVVLFLGAGATIGSSRPDGSGAPLGSELARLLADRFLGGDLADAGLSMVADLSIAERGLGEVQDYLRDLFNGLAPADFHLLLPTFRWRGLVTTNFDRLVEETYLSCSAPVQRVIPILSDKEQIDSVVRDQDGLALLKLHGCISRTRDPALQMILTADQYATHRQGRDRLFNTFTDWAYEYSVVFVGHAMRDSDLRSVLVEVSGDGAMRPPHYLVKGAVHPAERRMWEQKRITVLDGSYQEFLEELGALVPVADRKLLNLVERADPIADHFSTREPLPAHIRRSLEVDLEHVHTALPQEEATPQGFYRGFGFRWAPIARKWDVRRRLTDTLLLEALLRPEAERPTPADFYVIKAEAGAGKSVLLRRLAWEAAEGGLVVLCVRPHGRLEIEPVRELVSLTKKRIFLFVDSASEHVAELRSFLDAVRRANLPVTTISAERVNTWNTDCESLDSFLSEEYRLRYLSEAEIEALVELLEEHDSLGQYLGSLTRAGRVQQFEERAGRQLLVALHEATSGRPLEDIVVDEFEEIVPREAKQIYLTVCVLNRLQAPVRAGLIARVHGVNFEQFRSRFLGPLEHVVRPSFDRATGDFYYHARHPEIAQIVFERVLRDPADRFNEFARLLSALNLSYSSDLSSFRGLMRAKALAEQFPSREDVQALFELAERPAAGEAFLWQQRAIYEKNREDGNLNEAAEWLARAKALDPRDTSIVHSMAELARERALRAAAPLEKERLRREARALLDPLVSHPHHGRYALHTLAKLSIDILSEILAGPEPADRVLEEAIRACERTLSRGLQECPDDPYLLTAEAEFSRLLQDGERGFRALRKANEANPRDPFIAGRFARALEGRGELEEAATVLKGALESNRGDRNLNFLYATTLRGLKATDKSTLVYHFRRAFSPGDRNYEAQFWFARFAFESDEVELTEEAREIFRSLRRARVPHEVRVKTRDVVRAGGNEVVFEGLVVRRETDYGFLRRDGYGDDVFMHRREQNDADWEQLNLGCRVRFSVGFDLSGAKALSVVRVA